ncbi:hypothetical protein AMECASPLE_030527 [Ameca splendens]|uniref:Uncharacterized protein n=1 Tax=Ameca splendens TaxID=208324 RepID=A0ABV1A2U8_9TELE
MPSPQLLQLAANQRKSSRCPNTFSPERGPQRQHPILYVHKHRLLPCPTLSYAAISGHPGGSTITVCSGSVVDPLDGLLLVAANQMHVVEMFVPMGEFLRCDGVG